MFAASRSNALAANLVLLVIAGCPLVDESFGRPCTQDADCDAADRCALEQCVPADLPPLPGEVGEGEEERGRARGREKAREKEREKAKENAATASSTATSNVTSSTTTASLARSRPLRCASRAAPRPPRPVSCAR